MGRVGMYVYLGVRLTTASAPTHVAVPATVSQPCTRVPARLAMTSASDGFSFNDCYSSLDMMDDSQNRSQISIRRVYS